MEREDAEALRRRLYAPGASDEDLDRFRSSGGVEPAVRTGRSAPPPPEPTAAAAPVAVRAPARRRRTVLVVAAVVVLIAGGLGAVRLLADPGPTAPAPTPVAMAAQDRRDVEDYLAAGDYAGISAFLVTHRALPQLQDATRNDIVERMGTGDAVVTLSPVPPQAVSGRATVLLVIGGGGRAGWTTLRREVDSTGEQRYVPQVRREGFQQSGLITTHTYRYTAGNRPVELRVAVPPGVRWGAAVVFTD